MPDLLGRYELVEKVATGGMADLFLARQWGDGGFVRAAVVKRLHPHLAERPTVLDDFRNEAQLLAILDHPGIPEVFDFRCEEDTWFLAMRHVRGPTWGSVCNAEQSLGRLMPWQIAVAAAVELCDVLAYVHEKKDDATGQPLGIVHGDLGPENIVFSRDGSIKLLDFGIAGSLEHRARQREIDKGIRGTLGYISPEQIDHRHLPDGRADVFVLAILLYEATTGARLYPGDGLNFMNAVLDRDPPPPSQHRADYPPELEQVIMSALQRDPGQRPRSARAFRAMLEPLCGDGREALARYTESLFPAANEHRLMISARPEAIPATSIPPPEMLPDSGSSELTAEEHEEVLQDLHDLFSPDSVESEQIRDTMPPSPPEDELADLFDDLDAELVTDPSVEPPPPPPTTQIKSKGDTKQEEPKGGFYLYGRDED